MVNQSQLEHVKSLLTASTHLSRAEQEEWSSLLPFMNDKQLMELAHILDSAPEQQVSQKVQGAAQARPVHSQKIPVKVKPALKAGPPEIDLPAPHGLEASHSVPTTTSGNSVSAFINRNFAATLHRDVSPSSISEVSKPLPHAPEEAVKPIANFADIAMRPVVVPPPTVPAEKIQDALPVSALIGGVSAAEEGAMEEVMAAQPMSSPVEIVLPEAPLQTLTEEVVTRLKNLEDVRRLNVSTLRNRGQALESELQVLTEKFGYFSVQFALEHSPLYQTYLAVGSRVLKDHQPFEAVEQDLVTNNRPYLNKAEFESVTDLLQAIKGG